MSITMVMSTMIGTASMVAGEGFAVGGGHRGEEERPQQNPPPGVDERLGGQDPDQVQQQREKRQQKPIPNMMTVFGKKLTYRSTSTMLLTFCGVNQQETQCVGHEQIGQRGARQEQGVAVRMTMSDQRRSLWCRPGVMKRQT